MTDIDVNEHTSAAGVGGRQLGCVGGGHYCGRSALGRRGGAASVATLLERSPTLRVAEGVVLPRSTEDWMMRTVLSLPLETNDIESAATADRPAAG